VIDNSIQAARLTVPLGSSPSDWEQRKPVRLQTSSECPPPLRTHGVTGTSVAELPGARTIFPFPLSPGLPRLRMSATDARSPARETRLREDTAVPVTVGNNLTVLAGGTA